MSVDGVKGLRRQEVIIIKQPQPIGRFAGFLCGHIQLVDKIGT